MFRVLVLLLALLLSGCTNTSLQVQAHTANGIAQAANSSLPLLLERFRRQGFSVLQDALDRGVSRDEALAVVAKVEAEWEPIWKAWDGLQISQDYWADVIESGGDLGAALGEMKQAYCRFRAVWPSGVPTIPLAPLRCSSE